MEQTRRAPGSSCGQRPPQEPMSSAELLCQQGSSQLCSALPGWHPGQAVAATAQVPDAGAGDRAGPAGCHGGGQAAAGAQPRQRPGCAQPVRWAAADGLRRPHGPPPTAAPPSQGSRLRTVALRAASRWIPGGAAPAHGCPEAAKGHLCSLRSPRHTVSGAQRQLEWWLLQRALDQTMEPSIPRIRLQGRPVTGQGRAAGPGGVCAPVNAQPHLRRARKVNTLSSARRGALLPGQAALESWATSSPLLVLGSQTWNTPDVKGRIFCNGDKQDMVFASAAGYTYHGTVSVRILRLPAVHGMRQHVCVHAYSHAPCRVGSGMHLRQGCAMTAGAQELCTWCWKAAATTPSAT